MRLRMRTIIWDGLRRRKIRTALSITGIAIAATALFSLISLKRGYESGMRAELDNMGAQIVAVAKGCPYEAIAVTFADLDERHRDGLARRKQPGGLPTPKRT